MLVFFFREKRMGDVDNVRIAVRGGTAMRTGNETARHRRQPFPKPVDLERSAACL